MQQKNAVLIVDEERRFFDEFEKTGYSFTPVHTRYGEVHETLSRVSPRAVIFNLDHQKDEVKKILNMFHKAHPETEWIISGGEISKEDLVDFMRLGVTDYLEQPLSEHDKTQLIQKLGSPKRIESGKPPSGHRIVSFFSSKGGVGLSVCAVNLAVNLARRNLERVLLVDFVLQHGNIAELLDMSRSHTIHDMMENLDRIDLKLLDHSIQKHSSGVFMLPCPKQPEDAENFNSKETASMLKLLKESFDYTVIDAGHELNTASISCLDLSDTVFAVTTPDLPSLCNLKSAIETFNKLGYKNGKVKVVLNRKGMKGEIETSLIEKNLGMRIDFSIPDDSPLVLSAINQGVALHQVSKNADVVKALEKLSDHIASTNKKAG